MFDPSVQINFIPCPHRHITTEITGGIHFCAGEVWDDIEEHLLCLDCYEYVTEAEVRAAWGQVAQEPIVPLPEESDEDE